MKDKIIECQDKDKIADVLDNRPLLQVLAYVISLMGLKPLAIVDKEVLLDYVNENMNDYAHDEIKIAFTMALKGMLNIQLSEYPKLTGQLIEKVMAGYRKYRYDIIKSNEMAEESDREWTPEDIDLMYEMRLETTKNDYMEAGFEAIDLLINASSIYAWMRKKRKFDGVKYDLDEITRLAKEDWQRHLEMKAGRAKNMTDRRKFSDLLKAITKGDKVENEDMMIKEFGRKRMIEVFIKKQIEDEG